VDIDSRSGHNFACHFNTKNVTVFANVEHENKDPAQEPEPEQKSNGAVTIHEQKEIEIIDDNNNNKSKMEEDIDAVMDTGDGTAELQIQGRRRLE
jgi:hypothetical protein